MNFLINNNFFKSIPQEMKEIVGKKIEEFTNLLHDNQKYFWNLPAGFWIKKINKNFYEFRINSGDRIIFDIIKDHEKNNILRYCYFSTHDRALDKYTNLKLNNFKDLDIEKTEYPSENNDKKIGATRFVIKSYDMLKVA